MHLERLELQGFKTFAKKTMLSFAAPKKDFSPITAVVGPNGSGKSNVADAIRWVLGEQSLKLLRGKKSEDVIFSGSEGKSRAGFAEVSLTLNNEDHAMPLDYSQVTITRRLYRDGESEYLMNDGTVRLADIQLLLAQANVGQRSYSVIGQGMVDHILVSSPEERKAFFDDATGVKQFQIKRHEAMLKLKRTYENLAEVEMLLQEIEPRLKSLKRQVSRLEQRAEVEQQLRDLERSYYGTQWWNIEDQLTEVRVKQAGVDSKIREASSGLEALDEKVASMEAAHAGGTDDGMLQLQKEYRELQKSRNKIRDEQFETQKQIELAKVRAQSTWAPLPLNKIIEEIEGLSIDQRSVLQRVKAVKSLDELKALESDIDKALGRSTKLLSRLQRPAPEDIKPDEKLVARLAETEKERKDSEAKLADIEKKMDASATKEKEARSEVFEMQKELRAKQILLHGLENERNAIKIELARLEERRNNLSREIDEAMKERASEARNNRPASAANTAAMYPEIQRLRYKIELIGGIDPEIVKEHDETKARFEFLDAQVKDLREAIRSTEKIIDELDEEIRKQSEKAFKEINKEFQRFFQVLFGGGSCSLVKMTKEEVEKEEKETGVTPDRVGDDTVAEERKEHEEDTTIEAIKERVKEREDRVVGIDIQATPPGKKLKSLNLLSGGERALTSIALVSAIMAVNPGPFVLLDEVDAALDEANTMRFANILKELAKLTQFIVVTHNRATMEAADHLYGVTMGDDGVSNLISVSLGEVTDGASARR
jgi:chromosome segregation protein